MIESKLTHDVAQKHRQLGELAAKRKAERDELKELRAQLLREQIRAEAAKADIAEIELTKARIEESDRKVQPGAVRIYPFFGTVTPDSVAECIRVISHWDRRDHGQPITILINTGGGDVQYGLSLFDTIRRIQEGGTPVTTHVTGRGMSMGAFLLQAGAERVIDARAVLMVHEGSISLEGPTGQIEDAQTYLKLLRTTMVNILAERSTLTRRQIENRWKRQDWYLSAEEAVKVGLADRIA